MCVCVCGGQTIWGYKQNTLDFTLYISLAFSLTSSLLFRLIFYLSFLPPHSRNDDNYKNPYFNPLLSPTLSIYVSIPLFSLRFCTPHTPYSTFNPLWYIHLCYTPVLTPKFHLYKWDNHSTFNSTLTHSLLHSWYLQNYVYSDIHTAFNPLI